MCAVREESIQIGAVELVLVRRRDGYAIESYATMTGRESWRLLSKAFVYVKTTSLPETDTNLLQTNSISKSMSVSESLVIKNYRSI